MENEIQQNEFNIKEEQTNLNWLEVEENELTTGKHTEVLPSLKFQENKIVSFSIDFSKPFPKWTGSGGRGNIGQVTKAIIPVVDLSDNIKKNLWLNVKNPLYAEIVQRGRKGQINYRVIQTGKQSETKYNLVE